MVLTNNKNSLLQITLQNMDTVVTDMDTVTNVVL